MPSLRNGKTGKNLARNVPKQERARKRVETILDVTAALLDQKGYSGLTTNLIASRAEMSVGSLYKYFPDKQAILAALLERMDNRKRDFLANAVLGEGDWRKRTETTLDTLLRFMTAEPGYLSIKNAIRSSAELSHLETDFDAQVIAGLLYTFKEKCTPEQLLKAGIVAQVVMESANAIIRLARTSEPESRELIQVELNLLVCSYLENYIGWIE